MLRIFTYLLTERRVTDRRADERGSRIADWRELDGSLLWPHS